MSNSRIAEFRVTTDSANRLRASGAITFADAARVLAGLPDVRGTVDVDLAGLVEPDSATLAVLIAWAARAHARGAELRYREAPAALHNLARLSDLDALLLGATAQT